MFKTELILIYGPESLNHTLRCAVECITRIQSQTLLCRNAMKLKNFYSRLKTFYARIRWTLRRHKNEIILKCLRSFSCQETFQAFLTFNKKNMNTLCHAYKQLEKNSLHHCNSTPSKRILFSSPMMLYVVVHHLSMILAMIRAGEWDE